MRANTFVGTTLNYLPLSITSFVNSLFDPPARYNPYIGGYEVDCQATTPGFAIRIGGTDLVMNARDMIVQTEANVTAEENRCVSAIQLAGQGPSILGDAFLRNVVAVFDVGAAEMRFASRPDY